MRYVGDVFDEVASAAPIPSGDDALFDAALRYRLGVVDARLEARRWRSTSPA